MIPSRRAFDEEAGEYDRWFAGHPAIYAAQMRALRAAIPLPGNGLEVGVGSGRFAGPLGLSCGIDPSRGMARMAKRRGIEVAVGEGEHLPYRRGSFDLVLMMTVICFVADPLPVFRESYRVLAPGGDLVVGFIEESGEIATRYRSGKTKGRFLQFARFRKAGEVTRFFEDAGFREVAVMRRAGGFSVMRGKKQRDR